jgi:serine/threonine-protein kinase
VIPSRVHGSYALYETLGVGGAATVHLGVSRGREVVPVAIKRLHDRQSRQTAAVAGLLDEVRLSRHINHPNVVRIVDFVSDGEEMLAVMEYVHGEPLSRLLADAKASGSRTSVRIATAIAYDVLQGLYAAHSATDSDGRALALVHRDVTPENILVGADGVTRLMDFGVAKAQGRLNATKDGGVRGKLAYLAPEQVGGEVTARTDLYAVGLVLWEMLAGERVIEGESEPELLMKALDPRIVPPSTRAPGISPAVDAVVLRALCKEPEGRFASAAEQADAFAAAARELASPQEISEWVRFHGGARLAEREASVHAMLAAEAGLVAVASSTATTDAREPSAPWGFAVMGVGTLAVVFLGLLWGSRNPDPTPSPPPVAAPPLVAPVAPVAPVAAAVSSLVTPVPVPETSAAAPPSTVASARRIIPPPRATAPAHAPPSCDPPWYLDAKGIRRYDPACVK